MWKKSGVPPITTQRQSIPNPRTYGKTERSISATPPPVAVEFTLHTARPLSRELISSPSRLARAIGSAPLIVRKRSIGWAPSSTSWMRITLSSGSVSRCRNCRRRPPKINMSVADVSEDAIAVLKLTLEQAHCQRLDDLLLDRALQRPCSINWVESFSGY